MKIAIIVEGKTEQAFKPYLLEFLKTKLGKGMPKLDFMPCKGKIPFGNQLKREVDYLLRGRNASDYVIALTDVYTGTRDFIDAQDAKDKMRRWVGTEPRFYPHVAQYDFEAWLLPYWSTIKRIAGTSHSSPSNNPESVNHGNPPAHILAQIFSRGTNHRCYVKPRDAGRILRDNDLLISINACPELKALVNSIISLCGETPIP
jgi:hypothetical protein